MTSAPRATPPRLTRLKDAKTYIRNATDFGHSFVITDTMFGERLAGDGYRYKPPASLTPRRLMVEEICGLFVRWVRMGRLPFPQSYKTREVQP